MRQADKITYDWYDDTDECVFGDMFNYKETGRHMRPHYHHNPTKGVIIPCDKYDLDKKDWVDFAKGNVLACLGIGPDIEKTEGVKCVPKYAAYNKKGLVTYDMTHRDHIERPKYEINYTPIFAKMFHEDIKTTPTPGELWIAKINKAEMKHKKFTQKHRTDMTMAA